MNQNKLICSICNGGYFRVLHAGDESNCDCVGKCLLVCDSKEDCDGLMNVKFSLRSLIKVKFAFRCFIYGCHIWKFSNDGFAWCTYCYKERITK